MSDRTDAITLRQWAIDAQNAINATNWVGSTYTAQKDANLKIMIQRLGVLCTHLANQLDRNSFGD
jgi:hypothetical protein